MKFLRIAPRGGFYSLGQLKKAGAEAGGGCIFVERTVKVGRGAVIIGPCFVSGGSELCPGCRVLPFSHIEDSVVGRGATVRASTLLGCTVGEDCSVGPYACLRGGAKAGAGCRIGDFVEIKNSVLGSGCRVAHHAYIGDAEIGERVNIGCGVVFANYDGKIKSRSVVEDGCFIGCNCNIVAPAHIGRGAYIAAGTTVFGEVEAGGLCIGRARHSVVPGGAEGRYKYG